MALDCGVDVPLENTDIKPIGGYPTDPILHSPFNDENPASTSWNNPRKRPRSQNPSLSQNSSCELPHTPDIQDDEYSPSDSKRNRSEEWPLKAVDGQKRNLLRSEKPFKKSPSPTSKRDAAAGKRPSKFLEGSMNDRASNRPPSLYTREDESMERYLSSSQTSRPAYKTFGISGTDTFDDASIETTKPSGMYRFGRAIVNAFKPVAGWRGFSATKDEKERQIHLEKGIMEERRVKAEKAYAELKKTDFKGLRTSSIIRGNTETPAIKCENVADEVQPTLHRDSGIDMDGYHPSAALSKDTQESGAKSQPIPSPQVAVASRPGSPVHEIRAVRKTSMQFRKSSFQNLKKAKSHIQLPSTKRLTTLTSLDRPTNLEKVGGNSEGDQSLRKQPSRKDIAKQQKLSKKVSDLESQLEIARRNLKLSMNDPQARSETVSHKRSKPFKPGALPSLPSESILNAQAKDDKDQKENNVHIRSPLTSFSERQIKIKSEDGDVGIPAINPATQLYQELNNSYSCTASRKRKSDIGSEDARDKPDCDTDYETESKTAGATRPKRAVKPSPKAIENEKYAMGEGVRVSMSKQPEFTPRKSKQIEAEPVPPLPAPLTVFDPTKVDQAKILSMRSSCSGKTPFGKDSDDLMNLRKEFPTTADSQLANYLASLNEDNKRTDHTSMSHHNQPVTPLLPPPRTSPIKTEPLKYAKDRTLNIQSGQSPSKSSPASMTSADSTNTKRHRVRNLPKSQPLFPNLLMANGNKELRIEKPLPGIQKEDYEWPDDVF